MRHTIPRATFIALRARREAYQVASDILYEAPIDVRTVACRGCGKWIEVRGSTVTDPLTCPACHAKTPLPPYLRGRYLPRCLPVPTPLNYYAAAQGWSAPDEPSQTIPRWLVWFTVSLFTLGFSAVVGLLTWWSR